MDKNKFLLFSLTLNILFLIILFVGGIAIADSNGVWIFAEDIKPGSFGGDEGAGNYSFLSDLNVNKNLAVGNDMYINRNLIMTGEIISSTDNLEVKSNLKVDKNLTVNGNLKVDKDLTVNGNLKVEKDIVMKGDLVTNKSICLGGNCKSDWKSICDEWIVENSIN
jgi:hypothetical protein